MLENNDDKDDEDDYDDDDDDTNNNNKKKNCKHMFTKISRNNTMTTLNRLPTKTAILGT
jgi:hypothetical protein